METPEIKIILYIVSTMASIVLIAVLFYSIIIWFRQRKINKAILKRSNEVESFRNRMAGKYGSEALEAMPSELDMVEEDRDLTEENYLNLHSAPEESEDWLSGPDYRNN